ncbi:MAG TPA: glycoside hydrolase family 16 protein, partial [Chitinivibrionales bacterium]
APLTFAETILQDFTGKKDFDAFWDISTWGDTAQQYSAANVKLDTVNGWVQLKLNASPKGTKPVCGEFTSKRSNFLYGSYRASIKFDSTPGAVVGWFVYKDVPDLHEIDVEYLTNDLKHIHYTLHHIQTDVDYKVDAINFNPTSGFHEYRFDWYSTKVVYYIDGKKTDSLFVKVPDATCTIMLNYWSANIADWGGPAPTKDTYMYIDYMHYYSDYGASSALPEIQRKNSMADFRPAPRRARLFKCNGRILNTGSTGEYPTPIPGIYLIDTKGKGVAADITLKQCIIR